MPSGTTPAAELRYAKTAARASPPPSRRPAPPGRSAAAAIAPRARAFTGSSNVSTAQANALAQRPALDALCDRLANTRRTSAASQISAGQARNGGCKTAPFALLPPGPRAS
jgi:hypothetical protein